jgi:hypothetical protein
MIKQCFPCTACCEGWLSADINGHKMKPGTPCIHATKQGCGIYEKRPENPCVTFNCGWLQEQHNMPEHMKPSECGAIVLFDRKWHDKKVIRAVPTGNKIPADTLEWLQALARELSLPLLFSEHIFENNVYIGKKKLGYGPPSFIRAVETEVGPEDVMMY